MSNSLVSSEGALILDALEVRLLRGDTLAQACGFIGIDPIKVQQLRKNDEEFDAAIRAVQALDVENMVDRLPTLHDEIDDPILHRSVSDNIKYVAKTRARKFYGEKLDVTVEHRINLKDALSQAKARSEPLIKANVLDVKAIETDTKSVDDVLPPVLSVFD
jgi:hypothetical protein